MNRPMMLLAFAAAALASPVQDAALIPQPLAAAPNLTEIARLYMNFGAQDGDFTGYNCTAWSRLWRYDGVRHTPGMPVSQGWDKIEFTCEAVRSQFSTLFCDDDLQINAMSWNAEKRTAFRWSINGVLASTGEPVVVPVITALWMDADGSIQDAWDFLDPSPIHSSALPAADQVAPAAVAPAAVAPAAVVPATPVVPAVALNPLKSDVNISEIIRVYMNFGGFPTYPHAANCSQWALQFGDSGIRDTPGEPSVTGYDNLLKTCTDVRGQFMTMLNFESQAISVMEWNALKRVAFVWGIEGQLVNGNIVHVPAITTLFMDQDGIITHAWDFLDPSSIQP